MKLLACTECASVFSLALSEKRCDCGKTTGRYIDDLNAEFDGPGIPLGFHNLKFVSALRNQPEEGMGERFEAFVIPAICPTFKKR